MRQLSSVAFSLALVLAGSATTWSNDKTDGNARHYQIGLDYYAGGDLAAALASFREAHRLEPANHAALAAVRRVEWELAAQSKAARPLGVKNPGRAYSSRLEHLLLVSVPRWLHFDRTVGDALSDVGTLSARNARVVQFLVEKKFALARNRPYANDRELRALLRRLPITT